MAVTDDLPTPPLPLPTAITRVVAGDLGRRAPSCDALEPGALHERRALLLGHLAVLDRARRRRPASPATFDLTSVAIWPRSGQAAVVSATLTCTSPFGRDLDRPCTMPEVDDADVQLGIEDAREDAAHVVRLGGGRGSAGVRFAVTGIKTV